MPTQRELANILIQSARRLAMRTDLTPLEYRVLSFLFWRADETTYLTPHISQDELAKITGTTRRWIQECIATLLERGEICIDTPAKPGRNGHGAIYKVVCFEREAHTIRQEQATRAASNGHTPPPAPGRQLPAASNGHVPPPEDSTTMEFWMKQQERGGNKTLKERAAANAAANHQWALEQEKKRQQLLDGIFAHLPDDEESCEGDYECLIVESEGKLHVV